MTVIGGAAVSQAADISWSLTDFNMSTLDLSGAIVQAVNFSANSRSITIAGNTVTFANAASVNNAGFPSGPSETGGGVPTYTNVVGADPDLGAMLSVQSWSSGAGVIHPVTLGGLFSGTQYQIQAFLSDVRTGTGCGGSGCGLATIGYGDNGVIETPLVTRNSGTIAVGTFTADAATQTFLVGGGSWDAGLSGYVLKSLTPLPVLATITRSNGNLSNGNLSIVNNTASPFDILGYTVTSAAGALDQTFWSSVSNTYDKPSGPTPGNGTIDTNDAWSKLSLPTSHTDLSEAELEGNTVPDGGGDGGAIAAGQTLNLGNVWLKNPTEDVIVKFLRTDGTQFPVTVAYTGNAGVPYTLGDLNFNGSLDPGDWTIYIANALTNLSGLSPVERYQKGDFNDDEFNNLTDMDIFIDAYDADNGAGSFAAMLASVPEPGSVALLLVGGAALAFRRVAKRVSPKAAAAALVLVACAMADSPATAAVMTSVFSGDDFPSAAEFQTFNPHDPATPANAERTLREDGAGTRNITQTFQVASDITVDEIDVLFVRGASGNAGVLRIFDVANTTADDFTTEFNNAVANGFLMNIQFTMPAGLDPTDNTERTLRIDLTGADQVTLPAKAGPAGYAFSLSSVVDGNTAVNNEFFTWRFGDPGTGTNAGSWYVDGRVLYDDFNGANSTERRRDGLFAFNGDVVPEPGTFALLAIAFTAAMAGRVRRSARSSCLPVTLSQAVVVLALALSWTSSAAQAAVSPSIDLGANFPSDADFQPFDPHNPATPTGGERTVTTTRNLTQSFRLAEALEIQEIDLMYVRGMSGNSARLRMFNVANTLAGDITADFNDAVTSGFLLDFTFNMPTTDNDNTERMLRLALSGEDRVTLPATTGTAGYALNLTSTNGVSEVFTWRFGDPGTGSGTGWYPDGRVYYDDFISSGSTEIRRDGLFALQGDVVTLNLEVNQTTGLIMIKNPTGQDFDVKGYEVLSELGSLSTSGWTVPADWDKAGGANADALLAGSLLSSYHLAAANGSAPLNLGAAYNTGVGGEDLEFHFLTAEGDIRTGEVDYVTSATLPGDFDKNGTVDNTDLGIWKGNFGNAATDMTGDANGDLRADGADFLVWQRNQNQTGGPAVAVPEPAAGLLLAMAGLALGASRVRRVRRFRPSATALSGVGLLTALIAVGATVKPAQATFFVDRLYHMGESEGGVTSATIPLGGVTWDDAGTPETGQLHDLQVPATIVAPHTVDSSPSYVAVSPDANRPGASGVGIQFDGVSDFLFGLRFGNPSTTPSATTATPPLDYAGLRNRGFQLWVRPESGGPTNQSIVRDTDDHGVMIEGGTWRMRYDEATVNSNVAVVNDQWHHVMVVRPSASAGSFLYLNGVAIAARGGDYDAAPAATNEDGLWVGVGPLSDTTPDYFKGTVDQLEIFVLGTTTNMLDRGTFNYATDNPIANAFLSHVPGDVDQMNGLTQADVTAFIAGWMNDNRINGIRVGDISTIQKGDLNLDGITDLGDAFLLHQALIGATGIGLNFELLGVPEPSTLILAGAAAAALSAARRRKV